MPIYEYQCKECHHQFEAMQKISDARLTECPACHQNSLQKLISAAGFQLKGGGWYETDFKNPAKLKSSTQNKEATTESKTTEVKTEKKTQSNNSDQ